MKALNREGKQQVEAIAAKYNLKTETIEALLKAVINGNGSMAQFNIPELGGAGQWMRGGMTMVGDMFNNSLKTTVENLANELSSLVTTRVLFEDITNDNIQDIASVGGGSHVGNGFHAGNFASHSWPSVFGNPTSSGSQNNFRYAYFAPVRRLVIEENGKRTIYDTKHHHITGISQQQGSGNSYKFSSQEGPVDIGSLSVVSEPGTQTQETPEIAYDVTSNADLRHSGTSSSPQDIIFSTIEKINVLFERGQITEQEFKSKKEELLARL